MPTHAPDSVWQGKLVARTATQHWRPGASLIGLIVGLGGCQSDHLGAELPIVAGGPSMTGSATPSVAPGDTPPPTNSDGSPSVPTDDMGTPPATGPTSASNTVPVRPVETLNCEAPPVPRAPLRRITRVEYHNTIQHLLGIESSAVDVLPGEEAGSGFGNDADALNASRLLIDGYLAVARDIGQKATADAAALLRVTGCDPASGETECKQSFLGSFLTRVFRRPPDDAELSSYGAMFDQGQTLGGDFASGVRAVIERSLQAPQFLYRIEVGAPVDPTRGLGRPTGYEMATRLSYLLWSSAPDASLLDAAASGMLDTPEGVHEQARRMLDDDKAKVGLRNFHTQLFGTGGLDYLERDAEYYPTFKRGMGKLFREETEHFLDYVIFEGGGDLATVFTAPYTFVNGPLAELYGIPGVTGDGFVKVDLDTTRRKGLFTQASILTLTTPGSRTDPVVRGKWLYTKTLCGVVPDPPPDVPLLSEPEPGQPVRERLAQHQSDPGCRGCHTLMDPLGLPFEHFDGIGLWRDTDNGAEIDASGAIPVGDIAGPFDGAIEFAEKVAGSQDVRECYVGRYMTYAYGRAIAADDACSRAEAEAAFEQAQGNIKALALAITQTDGFLLRAIVAPGQ